MKLQKLFGPVSLKLSHFLLLSILTTPAIAFDSGSTGSDGAFAPVSSTTIVLPPDGILNFTTMNIPSGVTVRIASNLSNSPAFILVQGDAVIDGIIDISGVDGDAVSSNPAGGFAGGLPLQVTSGNGLGGNGQGPGGGPGGTPPPRRQTVAASERAVELPRRVIGRHLRLTDRPRCNHYSADLAVVRA